MRMRSPGLRDAIPLLAVAQEALWAYAWLLWLSKWNATGWAGTPLSVWSTLALAAAVELVSRAALARRWPVARVRVVVLTTAVILTAFLVRLELGGGHALWDTSWGSYAAEQLSPLMAGVAFGAYLVWRGIVVGREEPFFDDLYRRFLIGLAGMVVLILLWAGAQGSDAFHANASSLSIYVIAYFALGLLTLTLVNLQSVRDKMVRQEGASALLSRRWLSLLVGVIAAILAVAVGLASIFSFDLAASLARPLDAAAEWLLLGVLYGVIFPMSVLAAGLIYGLRFLLHLLGVSGSQQSFDTPDFSALREASEGHHGAGFPLEAALALKWGLVALVALLVALVLARSLFRYWKGKQEPEVEEVSESLWSWEAFKADLRSFLARLLRSLKRPRAAGTAICPPAAVAEAEGETRLFTVREIYKGLLWQGHNAGVPRHPAETPYEYARKLARFRQAGVLEVEAITEAYVAERYGGVPASERMLVSLNHEWRRLRSALRVGA